uniref:SCAN box domain-containing protein n=1 Tax=Balaenoptera musculus TaxID=9771 RepID=A0A8C0CXY8_BALMU
MLQRLLFTLPVEASTWVKLHHPKKATEGAPLWEDVTKIFEGDGTVNLQRHICGLHPGGVGAAGPCSPESVPGGDAGELWEPGLSGISASQTWCDFPVGEGRRTMADGERDFRRSKSRLGRNRNQKVSLKE